LIKGIPLNLFDDEIGHAAKRRQIVEWPTPERFPLNFGGKRVEHQVQEDLKSSTSPIIITGYTSLDYLIDFVAGLPADLPEKIRILLGSEPSSARSQIIVLGHPIFRRRLLIIGSTWVFHCVCVIKLFCLLI
jgi:hypothetical protein